MALLAFVPNRFNSCIKGHVIECLMRNLKEHALRHVMTLLMDFHSNNSSGEVLEVMVLGERYIHLADSLILDLIPSAIDIITFVVYFSHFIDAYIGLIIIDVIVIHIWTELVKNPKLFRMHQDYSTNRCKESQIKYDTVTYWDLVKTANCQDQEWRGYSFVLVDSNKLGLQIKCLQLFAGLSGEGSKAIGLAISVLVLLLRLTQDTASVGGLFILIGSWPNTFTFIGYLVRTYNMLMGCLSAGERFSKLLQTKPSIVDKKGATHLEVTAGRVEFDNVSFSYADDEPTVKKISFTVEGGKTVALIRPTGSGKSTLLNLLKRFIDPSKGSIKINSQNISNVTLRSLQENIAVVPQNLEVPNKSIREIVSYGLHANDVKIMESCKAASIHERIVHCNAGYNTVVGKGGIKLSGGKRQRIAIARAFLKNSKILLLDEATSAIDNITEKSIRESLKSQGKGQTILTVAHRLSTVKGADEIIFLENGEVKERGSHTELLNQRGSYYEMWTVTDNIDGTEGVGS